MNLTQIQEEAGRLLADANHGRWGLDVLTLRANQAQTEIQGYTNAVKTLETLTPIANTQTLTLNANTMDVLFVTKTLVDGSIKQLVGIGRYELEMKYPNWQQATAGEPLLFWYDATNQQINLYPKPDAANAISNGISVWESRDPADMVNSTDLPFDSNNQMIPYHYAIVHWVVAQCWMDDGTPESLGKSKFHKSGDIQHPGQYEYQLKRIQATFDVIEDVNSQIIFTPQGGRVGFWGTPSKSFPLG